MTTFEFWLLSVTYPAWRNRWLLAAMALGCVPFIALAAAKVFSGGDLRPEVLW